MAHDNERDDCFEKLSITVPKEFSDILRKVAHERKLPISRLIWYALDNELDAANAFDYSCPRPTVTYVEFAYRDEAHKIMNFLRKFPEGMTIDMINIMRRQIGVDNRQVVMLALRELLKSGIAVESKTPPKSKYFRNFDPDLSWIRLSREKMEKLNYEHAKLKREQEALHNKQMKIYHGTELLKPEGEWE